MSLLGIFLGLIVLVILTFKDMSILWVAPVAAMVTALCSGFNLLDAFLGYTNDAGTLVGYMPGLANYVRSWFPVFALGAIFGKLMDVTGAARAIGKWLSKVIGAKRAVAAVVLTCGLLTYGGISLFVVVFVMYPLGVELFREANLSRRILPGAISAGAFTFSMTAMPGSPQLTNIIAARNAVENFLMVLILLFVLNFLPASTFRVLFQPGFQSSADIPPSRPVASSHTGVLSE